MDRRAVLASVAVAVGSGVAGCLGSTSRETPADCPTSMDLGIEKPDDLTTDSVESYAAEYERAYIHEMEIPEDARDVFLHVSVDSIDRRDGGYVVELADEYGYATPTYQLVGEVADAPDGTDPRALDDVESDRLRSFVREVPAEGSVRDEVNQTVRDHLQSAVEDLPGEDGGYVAVEGETVRVRIEELDLYADSWLDVRYFVSDVVVRRTENPDEDADLREGELLECK